MRGKRKRKVFKGEVEKVRNKKKEEDLLKVKVGEGWKEEEEEECMRVG